MNLLANRPKDFFHKDTAVYAKRMRSIRIYAVAAGVTSSCEMSSHAAAAPIRYLNDYCRCCVFMPDGDRSYGGRRLRPPSSAGAMKWLHVYRRNGRSL